MEEVWKDIPGYEGEYQVSDIGRVRSISRYVNSSYGRQRKIRGGVLSPFVGDAEGHLVVRLNGHKRAKPYIHRLVMLAFIGEPETQRTVVRHLNGDPSDNRLENLAYGTQSDNNIDIYRQGKVFKKLSAEDVMEIRKKADSGVSSRQIALEYGVSKTQINRIRKKTRFAWLE